MPAGPETEKPLTPPVPEGVTELPSEPEVPASLETATGVKQSQPTFTAQVQDDQGKPLIQSDDTKPAPTITLPRPQSELEELEKGSDKDAATWFGAYWLRMLAKAARLGWKIITGGI